MKSRATSSPGGVSLRIDDGVLTDVLAKGNGMQRSVVFALLQSLIETSRRGSSKPIILAIEEPELYIHPHCQRLVYRVLREFAGYQPDGTSVGTDQVIYTTHSPAFVDLGAYERIAVVRKPDHLSGTAVSQCTPGALGDPAHSSGFKLLATFGIKHNELFFSRVFSKSCG